MIGRHPFRARGDRLLLGQGVEEAKEPFVVDGGVG